MTRLLEMVGFVHHEQARPVARACERLAVIGRELGRGQHDVPGAVFERDMERLALVSVERPVGAKNAQPEPSVSGSSLPPYAPLL